MWITYKDFYVLYDDDYLRFLKIYVQKIHVFLLFYDYLVDMFFSSIPPPDINLHYYNNKYLILSIKYAFFMNYLFSTVSTVLWKVKITGVEKNLWKMWKILVFYV